MPVYGHRLMSFRCLVTGEYAELKRQDDSRGTAVIYDAVSEAVSNVRSQRPMSAQWREKVDADYQTRSK